MANENYTIRRRTALKTIGASTVTIAGMSGVTGARPPGGRGCTLDGRDNLNYDGDGEKVINVTRRIYNSVDTGHCEPTAWAEIHYTQHIQVFDEGDEFVAIVEYNGQFDAYEGGETPNDCDQFLDGDESGPFDGGIRLTFDAEFNPGGSQSHGNLGRVDHGCNGSTSGCKFRSTTGWLDNYFDDVEDLALQWWGFIYHGGRAGTWVNAETGDCGNIS